MSEHIWSFLGGKYLLALASTKTDLDTGSPPPIPGTVRGSIDSTDFAPSVLKPPVIALSIVVSVISDQLRNGHPILDDKGTHVCILGDFLLSQSEAPNIKGPKGR